MGTFKFLEDIVTADAAIEVSGDSLEDLFSTAAKATFEVMVDTEGIIPRLTREIILSSDRMDRLFFDWLEELIYLKDMESILFCKFDVSIRGDGEYDLKARAFGEEINPERHRLRSDVKAITYHLFQIQEIKGGWKATFILDI